MSPCGDDIHYVDDVLRYEGEAYARRMQEAGVKVKLMRCPVLIPGLPRNGMVHGFLSTIGLIRRATPRAKTGTTTQYFEQAAEEIRKMVAA
jgi:acetyl esterase/lipase